MTVRSETPPAGFAQEMEDPAREGREPVESFALPRRRARLGFSLVEITLALGIIAFAFVTVFGLLPAGLRAFRQAMDVSIGSQIIQRVLNDAEQTDFSQLISQVRYFDDQGNELTGRQGAIYHVNLVVTKNPVFPGAPENDSLARVAVQVANNPGNRPLQSDSVTNLWTDPVVPMLTFATFVAKQK